MANRCRSMVLLAALGATAILAAPSSGNDDVPPGNPAPPVVVVGDGAESDGDGTVERRRTVNVEDVDDALAGAPDGALQLDLFDDTSVVVELAPSPSGVDGWQAWSGQVAGDADSSVVLTSDGTSTGGVVTSTEGTFEIRATADGHVVEQVDQSAFPDDSQTDTVPGSQAPTAEAGSLPEASVAPAADEGAAADVPPYPVLDVLVAYTPEALAAAGGTTSAINSYIASSIATTNSTLATTGIAGAVRLAGRYSISTMGLQPASQHLAYIAGTSDGIADGIHAAGDSVGADLIAVITEVRPDLGCGIGYLPGRFTITQHSCGVGNLSFPHELGHNLALHHDRYVSADAIPPNPNQVYAYGYGYVNQPAGWRTVMAYNNKCFDLGNFCTRLARFSNPDQTYGGNPLGRPWNAVDSADNRRVLNQTLWSNEELRSRVAPFTSWARFVQRQNRDFRFDATVTTAQANSLSAQLSGGSLTPTAYIDVLAHGVFDDTYAPAARLYSAYFLRRPDTAGLDYWVGRLRGGAGLAYVSQFFSASAEFRNLYGTLTNREFVELIYQNILGRPGEASGVSFWTGELDSGRRSRGWVMIGFSESSEYKTAQQVDIDTMLVFRGMLQRVPTAGEYATIASRRSSGLTLRRLILEVLGSDEYQPRAD